MQPESTHAPHFIGARPQTLAKLVRTLDISDVKEPHPSWQQQTACPPNLLTPFWCMLQPGPVSWQAGQGITEYSVPAISLTAMAWKAQCQYLDTDRHQLCVLGCDRPNPEREREDYTEWGSTVRNSKGRGVCGMSLHTLHPCTGARLPSRVVAQKHAGIAAAGSLRPLP